MWDGVGGRSVCGMVWVVGQCVGWCGCWPGLVVGRVLMIEVCACVFATMSVDWTEWALE